MDADPLLRQLAATQHGLFTRAQAGCLGVDGDAVDHRRSRGEWIPLGPRVLRAVSSADSAEQRALAAVLDAGEGAALSHHSAANWWGLPGFELAPTEVTVARCADERSGRLARIHRVRAFGSRYRTELRGVPVVRPELLALQLCGCLHPARAERALDRMWSERLLSGPSVRRVLDEVAASGVRGVRLLRALLDDRGPGYVPPASGLEARFAQVLREAGLPQMQRQVDLGDDDGWCGRVDFVDPPPAGGGRRGLIEVQSERYHSALVDVREDAVRLARLRAAGFVVGTVDDFQVWHRRAEVLAEVRRIRAETQRSGWVSTVSASVGATQNAV